MLASLWATVATSVEDDAQDSQTIEKSVEDDAQDSQTRGKCVEINAKFTPPARQSAPSSLLQRRLNKKMQLSMPPLEKDADKPVQKDLKSALQERFEICSRLGSGAAGVVHRALDRETGADVAIKTLRASEPGLLRTVENEFNTLRKLAPHPHIIEPIQYYNLCGEAAIAMKFFDGITLQAHMERESCLLEETSKSLAQYLLSAVEHMHACKVLHRDIKPENVLVSASLSDLKLIDFNVAVQLDEAEPLTPTGTDLYNAPEVLLGEQQCEKSDVWAAGLCVFFMLSGRLPQGRCPCVPASATAIANRSIEDDLAWDGPLPESTSQVCRDALDSWLTLNRDERLTASELLQVEWFVPSSSLLDTSLSVLRYAVPGSSALISISCYAGVLCTDQFPDQKQEIKKPDGYQQEIKKQAMA